MKKKVRIVKRIQDNGSFVYVIQQKHFLFRWLWVDAWENGLHGIMGFSDNNHCWQYDTLKGAKDNLCYFDGTNPRDETVYRN